ncbi:MAG: protein-export chaperone SecB [Clostridia bacterium]|nr:protein-export chaperone SecB [Clostridia bacterium]
MLKNVKSGKWFLTNFCDCDKISNELKTNKEVQDMPNISLVYYRVNELEFKFNEAIKGNISFQIKPKIECKVAKKEENLFVNLALKINEDISSPVPFNLKVVLSGTFKLKDPNAVLDEAGQRAQVNEAFTVLYPYLRATVSSITTSCNIPAYILPTVLPEQLSQSEQIDKFIIKKPQGLN